MKKFTALLFAAVFAVSCSSDDDSPAGGNPTTSPMVATVDGQTFSMQPEVGGNLSDPSGGMFGSDFHLLEGYKVVNVVGTITSREPIVAHDYYIRLAIPKIGIAAGTYNFTGNQLPDGYFADLEITSESAGEGEDEETAGGTIIVESWDVTTNRLKGTFEFTTNDGVSSDQTHFVSGSFNYILLAE
ncbi:hypothetical protein FLJC2902T_03160 [Flavobacterium limnosediminis JC2902]|uniref:Lipoprotein n=1 Tax=Flavobacterium limnosediminis JC2902 TaxID=1341181 RepID=V6ST06_9FLAO|nr:hypothetical protein [Flavobacterium limnosediminis]ESU29838.1 hypothetical protein FLJC2902T_03160 [Flavobacterium limnosediminis JC2902]